MCQVSGHVQTKRQNEQGMEAIHSFQLMSRETFFQKGMDRDSSSSALILCFFYIFRLSYPFFFWMVRLLKINPFLLQATSCKRQTKIPHIQMMSWLCSANMWVQLSGAKHPWCLEAIECLDLWRRGLPVQCPALNSPTGRWKSSTKQLLWLLWPHGILKRLQHTCWSWSKTTLTGKLTTGLHQLQVLDWHSKIRHSLSLKKLWQHCPVLWHQLTFNLRTGPLPLWMSGFGCTRKQGQLRMSCLSLLLLNLNCLMPVMVVSQRFFCQTKWMTLRKALALHKTLELVALRISGAVVAHQHVLHTWKKIQNLGKGQLPDLKLSPKGAAFQNSHFLMVPLKHWMNWSSRAIQNAGLPSLDVLSAAKKLVLSWMMMRRHGNGNLKGGDFWMVFELIRPGFWWCLGTTWCMKKGVFFKSDCLNSFTESRLKIVIPGAAIVPTPDWKPFECHSWCCNSANTRLSTRTVTSFFFGLRVFVFSEVSGELLFEWGQNWSLCLVLSVLKSARCRHIITSLFWTLTWQLGAAIVPDQWFRHDIF